MDWQLSVSSLFSDLPFSLTHYWRCSFARLSAREHIVDRRNTDHNLEMEIDDSCMSWL